MSLPGTNRHEGHVDCGEARVRKEHKFDRQIELVSQRAGDVCSDALRLTIRILHDEEDRLLRDKYQRDAQLAGECKFFHVPRFGVPASSVVNNNNPSADRQFRHAGFAASKPRQQSKPGWFSESSKQCRRIIELTLGASSPAAPDLGARGSLIEVQALNNGWLRGIRPRPLLSRHLLRSTWARRETLPGRQFRRP
jgi:hypothetical protein